MDETRHVRVGESFEICLEGTPTAGFSWAVQVPPESGRLVASLGDDWDVPSGVMGGSARQCFHLRALAPGEARLVFQYRRPWEGTPQAERTFVVQIEPAS